MGIPTETEEWFEWKIC